MPTQITATNLRASLLRTLDQVLTSGEAVEVERPGGTVRIAPAAHGESPLLTADRNIQAHYPHAFW